MPFFFFSKDVIRFPAFVTFSLVFWEQYGTVSYLAGFVWDGKWGGLGWDGKGKGRKGQDRIGWDETE